MSIKKIISGGQTGADRAGLDSARVIGIKTGGTAPKGWRISNYEGDDESDPTLADLGLVQSYSRAYPVRTKDNVRDSDGTVLFGFMESSGCKLTIKACKDLEKPWLSNPSVKEFAEWVKQHEIRVLNVAGNRLSAFNPDIYELVFSFFAEANKDFPDLFDINN